MQFDASLLKPGRNEITLNLAPTKENVRTGSDIPYTSIMYDCLRLEYAP